MPVASVNVDGSPALNRVKWAQSGMTVTVSDDNGKIWVYELGEVSQKNKQTKESTTANRDRCSELPKTTSGVAFDDEIL